MTGQPRKILVRYGGAVLVTALAVLLRRLLDPWLGDRHPFLILFAALALVARFGGRGPAMLSLLVGSAAAAFFLLGPRAAPAADPAGRLLDLVLYGAVGFACVTLFESLRTAAANEKVVATLEDMTDGFLRLDRGWRVVSMNREFERQWRRPRPGPLGKVFWQEWPAAVGTKLEAECRRAAAGQVEVHFEDYFAPFGRWFDLKATPTPDGGLSVFCRDVTQRKREQEALQKSEARLRRVFESNVVGVIRWDLDRSLILDANEEFLRMTGYTREDVNAGRLNFRLLTPPEWTPRNEVGIRTIRERGFAPPYEKEYFRKDGSRMPLMIAGTRFEDSPSEGMSFILDMTERKQAENALRQSEAEYRSLFDMAGVGNAEILLDSGRFVRANRRYCEMVGYTAAELLGGMTFHQLTHPDDRGRNLAAVTPFVQDKGGSFEIEKRYVRKGGSVIWVHLTGTLIRDSAGRPTRMLASAIDVTERREAEQALRVRTAELESLLTSAPLGLAFFDRHHRYTRVNAALAQMNGIRAADHAGRPIAELLPAHAPVVSPLIDRVFATGEGVGNVEVTGETPAQPGCVRHWLTGFYPVRDGRGVVEAVGAWAVEITDRKRAEELLRRSADELRTLSESLPQIVFTATAGGALDYVNSRWTEFTGLTLEESADAGAGGTIHPADLGAHRAAWAEALRAGLPLQSEFRCRRVDGAYRWLLCRAFPLKDAEGRVVKWFGTSTDMDDLRQAQDALREADRRKDEFLATLAHELRNPLAPVRNALQVLRLRGEPTPELGWARDVIDRQVRQMTRLIDDLLDVSRIATGKLVLRKERVGLAAVVQGAVETSRPLIEEQGHELTVALPGEPVYLDADLTRLAQVLLNLLTNAAKYTDRGGRIRLTAGRQGGEVVVSVQDTGIGIPADKLPTLFAMFSQVEGSVARSQGGLGIGLCLAKRLVEMHGGRIEAHSDGPGKGSEFVVRLPLPDGAAAAPAPAGSSGPAAGALFRILIVDDNRDGADSLAMMLQMLGNDTRTAYDGAEALSAAAAFRPDVILLDIGLPRLTGYEVCRRLRAEPGGAGVVVIAQTGWGQEEDRRKSHEAGFDHHLVKPVDPDALLQLLAGLRAARA
jgi:PAS domain S-box-containing protein